MEWAFELFNAPKCNTPWMEDLGSCRMKFAKNFHQNEIIVLRWMLGWKRFLAALQLHTTQNPCRDWIFQTTALVLLEGGYPPAWKSFLVL
jgi:hypothetical protein